MPKHPSQSYNSADYLNCDEKYQFISHCDFYSVCFSLEENAILFREISSGNTKNPPTDIKSGCTCQRFCLQQSRPKKDFVSPCDGKMILEKYGTICKPSLSMFFIQGFQPHFYEPSEESKPTKFGSSPAYYLNIYDHLIGNNIQKTNLHQTSVYSSIVQCDAVKNTPRYFRFEHFDYGSMFYREFFYQREHTNLIGSDPFYGPYAISIKRELIERKTDVDLLQYNMFATHLPKLIGKTKSLNNDQVYEYPNSFYIVYRIIARFTSIYNLRAIVPEPRDMIDTSRRDYVIWSYKNIIKTIFPRLSLNLLKMVTDNAGFQQEMIKLDENMCLSYDLKIGVIYCAANQSNEGEMYSNTRGSRDYERFLSLLGDKVELLNFDGYSGMLDTKSNLNGTCSVYTEFHRRRIMFHVSTMLSCDPNDQQQVSKKRYIGNDIVTVVFQDENSLPFSPESFASKFQHVFIVVRVVMERGETFYRVAIFRLNDVPMFGPLVSMELYSHDTFFREFILTKIVNAEYASKKSGKLLALMQRTKWMTLQNLKDVPSTVIIEKTKKITNLFKSNSAKRVARVCSPSEFYFLSNCAITWECQLLIPGLGEWMDVVLCVSAFCVACVSRERKDTFNTVLNKYLVAWRLNSGSSILRIYHRAGNSFGLRFSVNDRTKISEVLSRLAAVSNIVEASIVTYNPTHFASDSLRIDEYAVVRRAPTPSNYHAQLKPGDQILEVENLSLTTLTLRRFYETVQQDRDVRLLVARPSKYLTSGAYQFPTRPQSIKCMTTPAVRSCNKENDPHGSGVPSDFQLSSKPQNVLRLVSLYSTPHSPSRNSSFECSKLNLQDNVLSKSPLESSIKKRPVTNYEIIIESPHRVNSMFIDISDLSFQ